MPVNQSYGLLAKFQSEEELTAAARQVRAAGYTRVEAFSPYPSPDTARALGYHRSGVAFLVLAGGLSGAALGFFMLYWIEAYAWPLNVGGRPVNSWPMYFPITFELAVLTGGFSSFLGLFVLCRLPRFHHPLFNCALFARASIDGFYICIDASDPRCDAATAGFLAGLGPIHVEEVAAS